MGLEVHERSAHPAGFVHEAFLYRDDAAFVSGIAAFTRDALEYDEPVLVMVGAAASLDFLRDELADDARTVQFADMERVGANPACIIPAWADFVAANPHRRTRGVGEPIWRGRPADELVESLRHEQLLNVAFEAVDMWLVCPYDATQLAPEVVDEARCNHPVVSTAVVGEVERSTDYRDVATMSTAVLDGALPSPTTPVREVGFARGDLRAVRRFARDAAVEAGADDARAENFVVAVNEIATNSIQHGGGGGVLRAWRDPDAVVCEVQDTGQITDPLVGRVRPSQTHDGGAGIFLAHQFSDLVQVRSSAAGTVVRLRLHVAG